MRKIKLSDKKLLSILKMRGEVFKEVEAENKIIVEADKERTKLGYKMQRLKDKTTALLLKHKIDLSEFEIIGTVALEDNEVTVTIADQVEEYKKMLKEKKEKEDKK